MKKIFVAATCFCLAFLTLIGCTPASSIVKETTAEDTSIFANPGDGYLTEPKDYVIKSENYVFYVGEYLYFFGTTLSSFGEDQLREYGYKEGVSLKEQTVNGYDMTWFELIDATTLETMKKILFACEYAAKEKNSYLSEAKSYIELVKQEIKYASDGDPEGYIKEKYGLDIPYQSYLNAVQMQYVYMLYYNDLYNATMGALTEAEIKERAGDPEGKDTTPIRNVIYFMAENRSSAEAFISELGDNVTKESVKALAEDNDLYTVEDYLTRKSEVAPEIIEWSFDESRVVGESAVLKIELEDSYEYDLIFYFGEGEATYLFNARTELSAEKTDKQIEDTVSGYSRFKIDRKMTDAINI
jgi:hypothetical protein